MRPEIGLKVSLKVGQRERTTVGKRLEIGRTEIEDWSDGWPEIPEIGGRETVERQGERDRVSGERPERAKVRDADFSLQLFVKVFLVYPL